MTEPAAAGLPPGVLAERFASQLLAGPPASTAEQVTGRLLAIQAQDPRGARLAVRARAHGLTAADVDQALTTDRSLVVSWLNRGTLHLVRAEDYWRLHQLTTPQLQAGCTRRLTQEGISAPDADRAAALIERALADRGPLTRAELVQELAAGGLPTAGQATVFLFFLASLRGILVRGPMIGKQHAYVRARDWLGAPPAAGRDEALGWLARRFLAGHGPAADRDLAKWAGLPLRDARRGMAAIASELGQRGGGLLSLRRDERPGGAGPGGTGLAGAGPDGAGPGGAGPGGTGLAGAGPDGAGPGGAGPGGAGPGMPPPRLLGSFDPVLHGWLSRAPVLGRHEPRIILGGMFVPFAMVDGRAVGTWTLSRSQVALNPLEDLTAATRAALHADAADVARFLGSP